VGELRAAVAGTDELTSPNPRWETRASLAHALVRTGDDAGAARTFHEAAEVIRAFAATLAPERAASLLAAEPIREILSAAG
jgi:hypothetical protein